MHTFQTSLTDNGDDHSTTTDATATSHESTDHTILAPPDQRGGDRCCPWCLAAAETFEHHGDGSVGCGYCDAAIPVGADWYERGEKIVV